MIGSLGNSGSPFMEMNLYENKAFPTLQNNTSTRLGIRDSDGPFAITHPTHLASLKRKQRLPKPTLHTVPVLETDFIVKFEAEELKV